MVKFNAFSILSFSMSDRDLKMFKYLSSVQLKLDILLKVVFYWLNNSFFLIKKNVRINVNIISSSNLELFFFFCLHIIIPTKTKAGVFRILVLFANNLSVFLGYDTSGFLVSNVWRRQRYHIKVVFRILRFYLTAFFRYSFKKKFFFIF